MVVGFGVHVVAMRYVEPEGTMPVKQAPYWVIRAVVVRAGQGRPGVQIIGVVVRANSTLSGTV